MKRALILLAILIASLVPAADAAGPQPRAWAPYGTTSEVNAIAFAREGTTIAVALKAPTTPSPAPGTIPTGPVLPGTPCSTATAGAICSDVAILDLENGFARNNTVTATTPLGKTHIAVSRDGSSVASVGLDSTTTARSIRLHYFRVIPGTNFTSAPYERDIILGDDSIIPVGLALSDDGSRVAVLTGEGTNYVLRGYNFGRSLESAFEARAPGTPRALATAGDMSRLLVAGQFPVGNFSYGGAFLLPFAQGEPSSSHFDSRANNTDVRSAAISRDGLTLALGSTDGLVSVFHDGSLANRSPLTVGTAVVGSLALSDDGMRAAATSGQALTFIDARSAPPTALWNVTVPGTNITGLSLNRTGALLIASSSGAGAGVFAYDEAEPIALWNFLGDTRGAIINADGTSIVYALRSGVAAAKLPRVLTMELTTGGKVAAQRTIALPGNTTYEVSLRNDGAATERIVFEDSAPEVAVTSTPAVIALKPGAILRTNITVSVDQPLPGPRVFNVTARSLGSNVVANITLSLAPQPTLDVKLKVDQADIITTAGTTSTLLITIVNNGTSDADVGLAAQQTTSSGEPWNLTVSETSLTALRGTRTSVKVFVTPPPGVVDGTSSTIRFTLQGKDVFDTAQITFRVNPELKVVVNATGVTKFIEPGKKAQYNVTVTNTGSLPREFEVFYTITESSGRSWGVDMISQTVRLEPLRERVFPVTIIAPADAQPNDRVSVRVTASSIPEQANETKAIGSVTLFGVAVELKIPTPSTTPNGIPNPPLAGVVAITLFAALLLRRRSP